MSKYTPPAYLTPRPGEVTLKSWVEQRAAKTGMKATTIYSKITRGKMVAPVTRRENKRVVFVMEDTE